MTSYLGATVADGVSGKISVVQIWNRADSGMNFSVEKIGLAWTTTPPNYNAMLQSNTPAGGGVAVPVYQGFDFNFYDKAIGSATTSRPLRSCVASMSASDCPVELQIDAWAAPYPLSRLFHEGWKQTLGDMTMFDFTSPVVITPGMGLLVRSALNYCWTIVNVQGQTAPV